MKPSMRAKLDHLDTRLAELNSLLTSEEATKDMDAYRKLTREHSDIATVVPLSRSSPSAYGGAA